MRTKTNDFTDYSFTELLDAYRKYNENWEYLETSQPFPTNKNEVVRIIREDLLHNAESYDINSVDDFMIKYS